QSLAVAAEALYLLNLLLLPGLAFMVLLWLYSKHGKTAPPLARCHLRQTLAASLWAGVLLIAVNGLILALGGYHAPGTWVVLVLYFVTCHAALVLLGVLGVAKAMAGQPYRYPLLGRPCDM
ncbi:MAG TPA: hypothetical protein VIR60_02265, partial [Gammaproteobacteria bacterium]